MLNIVINKRQFKENFIKKFKNEIEKTVAYKDTTYWPEDLEILYKTYVNEKDVKEKPKEIEAACELKLQMQQMENSINKIQIRHSKNIAFVKEENTIKTNNNSTLMNELEKLRDKNVEYSKTVKLLRLQRKKIEIDIKRREQ